MPQSQEEQLIIDLYRFLMEKGFTYSQLETMTKANDYAKVLELAAYHYPVFKDYGVTPEQFMLTFSQVSLPQAMAVLDGAILDVQYLHICGISNNEIYNLINHFNGLKQLPDIIICHSGLKDFQLPNDDILRILVNNQPETLPELIASFKRFEALGFTYQQISQIAQQKQALQRVNMMMALHDESLAKLQLTKTDIVKIFASDSWEAIVDCLYDNVNNILKMQKEDLFLSALVLTDNQLKALEAKIRQWQNRQEQSRPEINAATVINQQTNIVFFTGAETRKPPAREALQGKFDCLSWDKWHSVNFKKTT